jgi:hypothetical protein
MVVGGGCDKELLSFDSTLLDDGIDGPTEGDLVGVVARGVDMFAIPDL